MAGVSRLRSAVCWTSAGLLCLGFLPILWFYADRSVRVLHETDNEGWVAYFADRAVGGGTLYPGPEEMVLNNYPPLSFYLVGAAGRLFGDTVFAGRAVSMLSLLVIAVVLGVLVARATRGLGPGAFTAALFLMLFSAYPGGRIGLNDPQLLGHAVMLSGFAVVWLLPARLGVLLCAAGLMVVAGLIKHNIIAVPLAVTVWAAWEGRRLLGRWLLAMSVMGLLGTTLLVAVWGEAAVLSILSPRQVSAVKLVEDGRRMLALSAIPLVAWLAVATHHLPGGAPACRREARLADVLVVGGLVELACSAGGAGVVGNMAFDLVIGLSLALGLAVGSLPQARPAVVLQLALVLHVALTAPLEPVRVLAGTSPGKAAEEARVRDGVRLVAQQPGPVLCLESVICWYAGKPFLFDKYNMGQQFVFGRRSEESLLGPLRRREYTMVAMQRGSFDGPDSATWARAAAVLDEFYVVDQVIGAFVFLVPRPAAALSATANRLPAVRQ